MNLKQLQEEADKVLGDVTDVDVHKFITKLLRELSDLDEEMEHQIRRRDDEIDGLVDDVDRWRSEARDWEDRYYEERDSRN